MSSLSLRLFDRVLARVPDTAPVPGDELPRQQRQPDKALHPTSRIRRKAGTQTRPARFAPERPAVRP